MRVVLGAERAGPNQIEIIVFVVIRLNRSGTGQASTGQASPDQISRRYFARCLANGAFAKPNDQLRKKSCRWFMGRSGPAPNPDQDVLSA